MSETQQAPLPGWYDDGTGDGLVRWWNGRGWEDQYRQAPKPIVPVKQLPRWLPPVLAVAGLAVIYFAYQLPWVHAFFSF
jgi:hypothetical protein